MKSIEILTDGDERRIRKQLHPGTYMLDDKRSLVVNRMASMECTEVWMNAPGAARGGYWREKSWHHDTLQITPSFWERVIAFFRFKPSPLPRAVLIVDRKSDEIKEQR